MARYADLLRSIFQKQLGKILAQNDDVNPGANDGKTRTGLIRFTSYCGIIATRIAANVLLAPRQRDTDRIVGWSPLLFRRTRSLSPFAVPTSKFSIEIIGDFNVNISKRTEI